MNHYYFQYQYHDDEYCDDHMHFFDCESDEEAREQARDYMNEGLRYLRLYTCKAEGEESDDDLCLYNAYYEMRLCESEHTREEAEASLEED